MKTHRRFAFQLHQQLVTRPSQQFALQLRRPLVIRPQLRFTIQLSWQLAMQTAPAVCYTAAPAAGYANRIGGSLHSSIGG
jgi:hypothetical protein